METFILVCFWICLLELIINVLMVVFSDFPKIKTESLRFYVVKVLIAIPFCLWAEYLLWA